MVAVPIYSFRITNDYAGEAEVVVAGGMENLSQAPHVLRGKRDTYKLGRPPKSGTEIDVDMEDYFHKFN